jgi:transposase
VVDSGLRELGVSLLPTTLKGIAMTAEPASPLAAIRMDLGAIFVSLELSKSTWLVTSLSPGSEKMSRHSVPGGDLPALLACLSLLREKAEAREGRLYPVIVIQEAGLDGFWIHRALEMEGWITSHVVDAASIAVSRRHRRAKTDRIDGETLVRTLMAWLRSEPRVCSMVRVPAVADEDRARAQSADRGAQKARQPDQRTALQHWRSRL